MGFNSGGTYTPASGAISASPGALIQSVTWNSVFTDISSALTSLGNANLCAPTTSTATTITLTVPGSYIFDAAGAVTVTLPSAVTFVGSSIRVLTVTAETLTSASANVVPLNSVTAGTAILAATAGKWALLQSNGTNWQIMAGN